MRRATSSLKPAVRKKRPIATRNLILRETGSKGSAPVSGSRRVKPNPPCRILPKSAPSRTTDHSIAPEVACLQYFADRQRLNAVRKFPENNGCFLARGNEYWCC